MFNYLIFSSLLRVSCFYLLYSFLAKIFENDLCIKGEFVVFNNFLSNRAKINSNYFE